ncbi:cyclic lactone autoinducer peptide [Ruminiclostridium cellobioparum]|jgi:cyclic lactone autoinducer peptide|nr:cyclic lactone autoinducer peptide [Ruminiclostridium cellobioparum]
MKKFKIKLWVLTVLSVVGIFAATTSTGACWLWGTFYQPECPKSLLK